MGQRLRPGKSDPPENKSLQLSLLCEDELLIVMSPDHPLAARRRIQPQDLAGETILIYPPREESTLILKVLEPAGVTPGRIMEIPLTEAIVFKHTLRDRSQASIGSSPGISQSMRRKVFMFPKNVTVAEVIEVGLERFGILEGVVDGGDEVEDKLTKRRSSVRVRYGLTVDIGIQGWFHYSSCHLFC